MEIKQSVPSTGSSITKPFRKVKEAVAKSIDAVDKYTSPREDTQGNLKKGSYFQACFNGATDGFLVMGPAGIVVGAAPAAAGVAVVNKTGKLSLGIAAGTLSGAAAGAAVGTVLGGPIGTAAGAVTGSLLGAFETFRGYPNSKTRDAAGNANMIAAPFVPGPAKIAAGIGSAIGSKGNSKLSKSVIGAIAAGAIGGVLAAVGFAPISIPVAIAATATAGALGPHFGPRYSQFFRNLSSDAGKLVEKGAKKIGLIKEDDSMGNRKKNAIGAVPSSFIKEGIKGFALSDGNIPKMLLAGLVESFEQAHIFLTQKIDGKEDKGKEAEAKKPGNNPAVLSQIDENTTKKTIE